MPSQDRTIIISHPKLLICEGKDDVRFSKALLKHLAISDIDVLDTAGKTNLRAVVSALVRHPDFPNLTSLGLFRDADDNPAGAFQSLCDSLRVNGLGVPPRAGILAAGKPTVGVLILPSDSSAGMLEDVCLQAVSGDPSYGCLDDLFQCVNRLSGRQPKPIAKARLHAWLATQSKPDLGLGEAAEKGYWPWDSPAFDLFKQFLQAL